MTGETKRQSLCYKEGEEIAMPHIEIKCYPGRSDAKKKMLADKIAKDVVEIFKTEESSVSVAIYDVPQEEWKEQVWDRAIAPNIESLYKKPGYDYND